ncbi:MAG TPA: hypothetical protein VKP66_13630 [Steroidobacteraceae bacterium]|nr:hypothetical protein [Steroidobacteraceae bacterium]
MGRELHARARLAAVLRPQISPRLSTEAAYGQSCRPAEQPRFPQSGCLQAEGLINCRRGHIKVLDRPKLEQQVCECYAVVKREYARLLPYEVIRPLAAG